MLATGRIEMYRFEGAKKMNNVHDSATAVVDKTSSFKEWKPGVVDLTITGHGYVIGDRPDIYNHIYIQGTTYYDGLRRIVGVPDANSLYVVADYVAETLTTTDNLYPGLSFDEPWLFVGYSLHQSADGATAENFVILKDADAGTSFDTTIVTVPMNGVTNYCEMFERPWPIAAKDIVYCTYTNTNSRTWGLELYAQRIR